MYNRILVPLDGSELAEQPLPYVQQVASRLNSEVILLASCDAGERWVRPLRSYLDNRAEEFRSLGVRAGAAVVQGDAATEILDFAEANNVDLIAMSTHGRSGPALWVMGSVANKVFQRSRIPLLLVRPSNLETIAIDKEFPRILLLLDGSTFTAATVPYIEALAKGMTSDVVLLRVVEPVHTPHVGNHTEGFDTAACEKELTARAMKETRRYLTRMEGALRRNGVKATSELLVGKPTEVILQYCEENPISLIAMATHGFSGITKWICGSVASKIVQCSSKPLLLVRPPMQAREDLFSPTRDVVSSGCQE